MTALAVLEKVKNPFLLHEPARKIEIGLAILNTVFPMFVLTAKLEITVESLEYFFQNVGYGFLLKNSALCSPREKPNFRENFSIIAGEFLVAITL